jgi:hypothetical protein
MGGDQKLELLFINVNRASDLVLFRTGTSESMIICYYHL